MISVTIPKTAPNFKRFVPPPYYTIQRCLPYIDTLYIFFRDYLPRNIVKRVKAVNGARNTNDDVWAERCREVGSDGQWVTYGWMLKIEQPTYETLKLLAEYDATVSRLDDVAYDFITEDEVTAYNLGQHLIQHVIFRRRRAGMMYYQGPYQEETTYYSYKARNRDLCIYSDLPSKVTGEACSHLEIRLKNTTAVKRSGINSTRDLLSFNPREHLKRHIRLADNFNWDKFTNKFIKQQKRLRAYKNRGLPFSLDSIRESIERDYEYPKLAAFRKQYEAGQEMRLKCWLECYTQGYRLQRLKDGWCKERIKLIDLEVLKVPEMLNGFVENIGESRWSGKIGDLSLVGGL
jgi:hypothetical protein